MIFVSSCSCHCPIHWSQLLSREWRCSWGSANRRSSNYIWVSRNFIAFLGACYIRGLAVYADLGTASVNSLLEDIGLISYEYISLCVGVIHIHFQIRVLPVSHSMWLAIIRDTIFYLYVPKSLSQHSPVCIKLIGFCNVCLVWQTARLRKQRRKNHLPYLYIQGLVAEFFRKYLPKQMDLHLTDIRFLHWFKENGHCKPGHV